VNKPPPLTRGQAVAIGVRLNRAEDLVAELRRLGIDGDTLQEIAEAITWLREGTGARIERLQLDRARMMAIELSDLALQIRPALKGYGSLPDEIAAVLASGTDRLAELAFRLLDELEALRAAHERSEGSRSQGG